MNKKILLWILVFSFFIFIVSAAPPIDTYSFYGTGTGYNIDPINNYYGKSETNFTFNFHIFNTSNGYPIARNDVSCFFHLYNQTGNHIWVLDNYYTLEYIFDYSIKVAGSNFTTNGVYPYIFQCNSSRQGGYFKGEIIINPKGEASDEFNNFSFFIPIILFIFLAILVIIGLIKTNKIWLKVVLADCLGLILLTLTRLTSWILSITNASSVNFIKTIDFFYSIAVWTFVFLIAGSMIFLVIYIVNGIKTKDDKIRKEDWSNWGKDGFQ